MRTFRWLAIPAVAVALLSVACGGDDGGDSTDGGDTDTTATATSADATATTEGTATETATGASEGGAAAELSDIFGGFSTATFNVTYNIESDDAAEMSGEWTWIRDSEGDRSRFEIDSPEGLIVMIDTPEQSLLCADGACFDTAEAMGGVMPNIGDMFTEGINNVESEAATANVEQVDGREIAGTDTECVEFTDEAEGLSGLACYADGGIPLLVESETADGNFRMEATSYSSEVSDEDFEAPFPVTSLGG